MKQIDVYFLLATTILYAVTVTGFVKHLSEYTTEDGNWKSLSNQREGVAFSSFLDPMMQGNTRQAASEETKCCDSDLCMGLEEEVLLKMDSSALHRSDGHS